MKISYGNSSVHTKVCDDIIEDTVKIASQHNHWTESQQKYCSAKFREVRRINPVHKIMMLL